MDKNGCWLVSGWLDKCGYGRMRIGKMQYTTHRAAWTLYNGEVPDGLCVLHKCDVPRCVNPNHLYLGDNQQNVNDRLARGPKTGGAFRGSRNQIGRLSESQVISIRNAYKSGSRICDLTKKYEVSRGCIEGVCYGKNWTWLEGKL